MARREYKGAAPETELASGISDVSTTFNVVSGGGSGYPTGGVGPFFVVIDPGTANEEKILCQSRTTDAFSCAGGRGSDDTVQVAHSAGAKVRHVFTKTDADEANAHVNASTGVHGRTSALVAVDDVQTLTNKAISGASNTLSAIPQSAVTSLVADLAAKLAVAAVHDTWEAIIAAAPGANWQAALAAGLDADSATVLGAMGTGWPAILGAAPGSGWATPLAAALGSNWATAFGAALAGDWTNILDSPINGGWLNVFAVDPSVYRSTEDTDAIDQTAITSTTFAAGSSTCGLTYVAPPSGVVHVVVGGNIDQTQNTFNTMLSFELRQGATIGSGTVDVVASGLRSISVGQAVNTAAEAELTASFLYRVSGQTPGNSYNVRTMHAIDAAGANGNVYQRYIYVIPSL